MKRTHYWAADLLATRLAEGADPTYSELLTDIDEIRWAMGTATPRPPLEPVLEVAATYLTLNWPIIADGIKTWDALPRDERFALKGSDKALHHPEDMRTEWAWSTLTSAQTMEEEANRKRRDLETPNLVTLNDDKLNQLKRVLEYAKWRPYEGSWRLRLRPISLFLPQPYGESPFPSQAFTSTSRE